MIISKYSCRLCLKSRPKKFMSKIFNTTKDEESNIVELIKDSLGMMIHKSKKCPKYICTDCYKTIKDIHKFKLMCLESEKYIKMIHSLTKLNQAKRCGQDIIEISDSDSEFTVIEVKDHDDKTDQSNFKGNAKEPENVLMSRNPSPSQNFDTVPQYQLILKPEQYIGNHVEKDMKLTDKISGNNKISELQFSQKSLKVTCEPKSENCSKPASDITENYEECLVLVEEENNDPNSSGTCIQYPPDEVQFVLESEEINVHHNIINESFSRDFSVLKFEVKHEGEITTEMENFDPPISALYPTIPPPIEYNKELSQDLIGDLRIIKMEFSEDSTFQNEVSLQEHNKKRHESNKLLPTNYDCPLCSKSFNRSDTLELHKNYCLANAQEIAREEIENQSSEKPSLLTEIKTITCVQCEKEFIYKHDYLDHLESHNKKKRPVSQYQDQNVYDINDLKKPNSKVKKRKINGL